MKLKVFLIISFFLIVLSWFLYGHFNRSFNSQLSKVNSPSANLASADLIVPPQAFQDKVIVSRAVLNKNGFVVVRKMDAGKLSQIVEVSKPLKVGINKDIIISLGDANAENKELIVMMYEDFGNDGIFNDLDLPLLDDNGSMTARYVKTGKMLPASITEGESADAPKMAGMKNMAKIRYTDKGFTPENVTINSGDMIEFINDSNKPMWVASAIHPSHEKLPTFDQFKPYKKGSIYRYVFDKKGAWEYHDHLNPSMGGTVIVN